MRYLGREGYRRIAREVLEMRDAYLANLGRIPGMVIRGTPELAVIAFGCDDIDMGKVATRLGECGWIPGMVRDPPSLHLMMSLHHAAAREAYVRDVAACVEAVRQDATIRTTQAVYS
jgi:glutamate/tyrosine decarboxylase-like PLP-dependent enzyme